MKEDQIFRYQSHRVRVKWMHGKVPVIRDY